MHCVANKATFTNLQPADISNRRGSSTRRTHGARAIVTEIGQPSCRTVSRRRQTVGNRGCRIARLSTVNASNSELALLPTAYLSDRRRSPISNVNTWFPWQRAVDEGSAAAAAAAAAALYYARAANIQTKNRSIASTRTTRDDAN